MVSDSSVSELEVARWRADTPGTSNVLHLNNAGSALVPRQVVESITDYLSAESLHGGYEQRDTDRETLDATYESVAKLIGARADEIFLAENATRAWDQVFYGLPLKRYDRILTGRSEYSSNVLAFLHRARLDGVEVRVIPDDGHGQICLEALADELAHPAVRVVALTHVPTYAGLVNPAAEVGKLCQKFGTVFLLDACQSVGQLEIDVQEIGCDVLTATSRKFLRGPRGIGFGYVRAGSMPRLPPAWIDLRSAAWTQPDSYTLAPDARRYETWEQSYALVAGLGAAAAYALRVGMNKIEARVDALATDLRQRLEAEGYGVIELGQRRSGIVTFPVNDTPDAVMHALRARDINVGVSTNSHVRWDIPPGESEQVLRASVHYYNTVEELERFVVTLNEIDCGSTSTI